jgi:hypothetical protein
LTLSTAESFGDAAALKWQRKVGFVSREQEKVVKETQVMQETWRERNRENRND